MASIDEATVKPAGEDGAVGGAFSIVALAFVEECKLGLLGVSSSSMKKSISSGFPLNFNVLKLSNLVKIFVNII